MLMLMVTSNLKKLSRKTKFLSQQRLFNTNSKQKPLKGFGYYDSDHIDYPSCWHYKSYPKAWNDNLRNLIRARDLFQCQECRVVSTTQKNAYNNYDEPILDIHHIDYNRHNLSPDNLITLCHGCHSKTNSGRTAWRLKFEKQIIKIYEEIKNGKRTRFSILEIEAIDFIQMTLTI